MIKRKECLPVNVNGNKKLVNTEKVRWMIWNIPAVTTCPYATEHCKGCCYALKAEKQYPSCKAARERNYNLTLSDDFSDRMIETIEYFRNSRGFKNKLMIVRIHESGDFYSQEYLDKWLKVVKHFENDNTILFNAYTKSVPFLAKHNLKEYPNFRPLFSLFDDTKKEYIDMAESMDLRVYTAVKDFKDWKGARCRCEDCANCLMCENTLVRRIACEIH